MICAALTWLRDDEKRQLYGDQDREECLDWLEQAEKEAQAKQILEDRQEKEQKLKAVRARSSKAQNYQHTAKRVVSRKERSCVGVLASASARCPVNRTNACSNLVS